MFGECELTLCKMNKPRDPHIMPTVTNGTLDADSLIGGQLSAKCSHHTQE